MKQGTTSPEMFCPRHHVVPEACVGPGLETRQSAFLDQFVAEATEPKSGLVVLEMRSCDDTKPYIGEARAVAVAAFEAEINRSTNGEGKDSIRKQCGRHDLGQTSRVARDAGSLISGKSMSSSIVRFPSFSRSAHIRAAVPLRSDAATIRRLNVGGSRRRRRPRGRSD